MAAMDLQTQTALSSDARGLDALRRQASRDPKTAAREAARQFESLFMQQMLKSMRAAMPSTGLVDNAGTKLGTDLLDAELAVAQPKGGAGSLTDLIARQIERQMGLAPGPIPRSESANASLPTVRTESAPVRVPQKGAMGFVQQHKGAAEQVERATGIPASFMLGQAALETGWGGREIIGRDGTASHNLFGIKAGSSWKAATVDVMTTEYIGGRPQKMVQKFRAYGSYAESFADYARLVSENPRYQAAMDSVGNARAYAQGLARGGYATDPRYADKLARVIATAERLSGQVA